MAKQIAWLCCPIVGTFDDITFYKMDGQYYARAKSSLTSKRVKTSPEFKRTMVYAGLMVRASKIGTQIYKALPPGWRQFWMYRSFTGEAFTLLKENPYNDEEVKDILWKCYVEYWEQRKAANPDDPIWQPIPKKIRKPRKYSEESIQRLLKRKDKHGRRKWIDPEEEQQKRLKKERNAAAYARLLEKERLQALTQASIIMQLGLAESVPHEVEKHFQTSRPKVGMTPICKPLACAIEAKAYSSLSPWHVTNNGVLQITESLKDSDNLSPPREIFPFLIPHELFFPGRFVLVPT